MSRPVRTLFLRDHLIWSGGTIYFLETLPRIDKRRVDFVFAILSERDERAAAFEAEGVSPAFLAKKALDPCRLVQVLRLVRTFDPDVIHLSGPKSTVIGQLVARLTLRPTVVLFNNALPVPRLQRSATRLFCNGATTGMAVSRAMKAWGARTYGIPPQRIAVLYAGHDTEAFALSPRDAAERRRELRHAWQIDPHARVVALPGRVVGEQKGHFGMVRAMPTVLEREPRAHLLIVGDGPDLPALRRLARCLELCAKVTFTGERRDMPNVMAAVDVVVIPSLGEEAFGFVALEAAAAGLPVVAFRSGGLPEAIVNRRTGLLVDAEDWQTLARVTAAVLARPRLAAMMGRRGPMHARRFDVPGHVEQLTRLLERFPGRGRL